MKKLVLLLFVAVLSISCQQEATIPKTSSDLEFKSTSTDQNDVDRKKYFGVFVTTDMDLHGELRIDLENDVEFPAIVT